VRDSTIEREALREGGRRLGKEGGRGTEEVLSSLLSSRLERGDSKITAYWHRMFKKRDKLWCIQKYKPNGQSGRGR
jgi:hypothetical protein